MGSRRVDNSIAGSQGRVCPVVLKLKEIPASRCTGHVLSSDTRAFWNLLSRDALPDGLQYFAEREVGGSPITIAYGHTIDYVHDVLGEFSSFQSRMQIQRPRIKIQGSYRTDTVERGNDSSRIDVVQSHVPDPLAVHAKLAEGKVEMVTDATLSITLRVGEKFKGTPDFA